jgi:hypothetical protein
LLIRIVPIFRNDVDVLIHLTDAQAPPLQQIRASRKAHILYCCGDASGSGFGWCIDFGYEYGTNLENGVLKFKRLHKITGSCGT